ncbi:MAG: FAD-dependent oxidoreductase [Myxococcota bacterium]
MKRRTFLGAALGVLASRVGRAAPTEPPEVIVVGGGPAGISCALELAEKGVRVTLVEAGSQLGGKAKGWRETLDGDPVDVEHGIHGWWYQYVHFHDLLARYSLSEGLREARASENGMRLEDGYRVTGFFTRAGAFIRRANARGHGFFPTAFKAGQRWMRKISLAEIRAGFAGKSVADWVANDPPLTVYSVFDEMMAHSMYFRPPAQVDAAEYIEGERFYFSGGPKNDRVQWLNGNPDTLVWTPLANAIAAHGGVIERGSPVTEVLVGNGRVVGVRTGRPPAEVRIDGPLDAWRSVELDGERVWVGPGEEGPVAYSAVCTHQGCAVDRSDAGFVCPCHGGRYDGTGQPVAGPPEHPLSRYRVEPDGSGFVVKRPDTRKSLYAPWVVLAVDVPALQALVGELLPSVRELQACREVVARFWVDRDVSQTARSAVLLEGFAHSSNGFLVHRLQAGAGAWAAEKGGAVVEIQAYRGWSGTETDAEMLEALEGEMRAIWTELADATVLKRHLTVGDAFTWFQPGWRAHAQQVRTDVDGLLLAGDHVHVPDSEVQFMERAVLTGRMAANIVLRATGRRPADILPPR